MDTRPSDACHPNERRQILTCVDTVSRGVKWTLSDTRPISTRERHLHVHLSFPISSIPHYWRTILVNLFIRVCPFLLACPILPTFMYPSLSLSLGCPHSQISKSLLKMDTLQGCFSNYALPSAVKVTTIRAPFTFSQSQTQKSGCDRRIVIAAHSRGSFMAAG